MTLRSPETTGQQNTNTQQFPHLNIPHRAQTCSRDPVAPVGNTTRFGLSYRDKQASKYLAHNFHILHNTASILYNLQFTHSLHKAEDRSESNYFTR